MLSLERSDNLYLNAGGIVTLDEYKSCIDRVSKALHELVDLDGDPRVLVLRRRAIMLLDELTMLDNGNNVWWGSEWENTVQGLVDRLERDLQRLKQEKGLP